MHSDRPSLGSALLDPAEAFEAACLADATGLGTFAAGEGALAATFLAASAGFGSEAGGEGSFAAACCAAAAALPEPKGGLGLGESASETISLISKVEASCAFKHLQEAVLARPKSPEQVSSSGGPVERTTWSGPITIHLEVAWGRFSPCARAAIWLL